MNKDKIEIARSFSKTIQLSQYNPVSVFMSAKAEIDDDNTKDIKLLSEELYNICKKTVDNDIEELKKKK